jgi:uncharacterized protein YcbX
VIDPATVAELWRFPVKSMRGERVESAAVTDAGLAGDRAYAVVDRETGRIGSAKHPRMWGALLACAACYDEEPVAGKPPPPVHITLPDGRETGSDDPAVDERLSEVFARPVQLVTSPPPVNSYLAVWPEMEGVVPDDFRAENAVAGSEAEGTVTDLGVALASPPGTFFDVAALHVVTRATLERLGELEPESRFAVERYRPNVVLATDGPPFAENEWGGAELRLGSDLTATVLLPTMRCIMTTLPQGDLPRDNNVLRAVSLHNRVDIPGLGTWSCVGAYAAVTAPGTVGVADTVVAG